MEEKYFCVKVKKKVVQEDEKVYIFNLQSNVGKEC